MSNQIYFTGFRAEHFTGWDNSGSPSYTSVSSTSTLDSNAVGTISLTTSGNVIWKELSLTGYDPVYFSVVINSGTTTGNYANFVVTDGSNAFRIMPINASNQTNDRLQLDIGTYDTTNRFTSSSSSIVYDDHSTSTTTPRQIRIFLKLYSSNGTSYDTVDVSAISSVVNQLSTTTTVTLTKPLNSVKSIFSSYTSANCLFYYCVVANFDLTYTYLDYTTASAIGTTNQWNGDVTSFSTYPVSYSSTGGMSSNTTNTSVSYSLTKTLNTETNGYNPLAMILSSNDITKSSSSVNYTNGYSGSYTVSIPNYLASGTGISIVAYVTNSGTLQSLYGGQTLTAGFYFPGIILNDNGSGNYSAGYAGYWQSQTVAGLNIASSLNYGAWNQFTIYNNNGTLTLTVNGNTGTQTKTTSETIIKFFSNSNIVLGGVAYINSATVPSYPFDKASNVVSYIDFIAPTTPVVYGDTTQLEVTSKSLIASTAIINVPEIEITSTTDSIIPYTNGYSGTYTVSVPNYLASGTGIEIIFYVGPYNSSATNIFQGQSLQSGFYYPCYYINNAGASGVVEKYSAYYQSVNGNIDLRNPGTINYNSWNTVTIFNNSGTLILYTNGTQVSRTTIVSETILTFSVSSNIVLASIAYVKSVAVGVPFNQSSDVTSYIDFADPNNPVVYGDTTQLSVTAKSLTTTTPISNIPNIQITSSVSAISTISPYVTNGTTSITTSDTSTVTTTGNNSTFYLMSDPLTNSNWKSSNIQSYQFGITKIE